MLQEEEGWGMSEHPLILWFRRDLRLGDQPMLAAAVATGRPLLAVFVLDPETEAIGAAAKLGPGGRQGHDVSRTSRQMYNGHGL